MRQLVVLLLISLATCVGRHSLAYADGLPKRPNILLIVVDDIGFKKDPLLRRVDRLKPGRVILRRIDEEPHVVPPDQWSARHPLERFVNEIAVHYGEIYVRRDRIREPCAHICVKQLYSAVVFCKNHFYDVS